MLVQIKPLFIAVTILISAPVVFVKDACAWGNTTRYLQKENADFYAAQKRRDQKAEEDFQQARKNMRVYMFGGDTEDGTNLNSVDDEPERVAVPQGSTPVGTQGNSNSIGECQCRDSEGGYWAGLGTACYSSNPFKNRNCYIGPDTMWEKVDSQ